jgi:Leu/Phe-tRNA-protein transferase
MKTIFADSVKQEIIDRINKLHVKSPAVWGKMNVAQMLAHCTEGLAYSAGDYHGKQLLIGKLFGPFLKKSYFNEKPFAKHSPTAKEFTITDQRDFDREKKRLLDIIDRFHRGGEKGVTSSPHMFFGKLTPAQWGIGMYKHLDHHLRQFGV